MKYVVNLLLGVGLLFPATAAEPTVTSNDLPRFPPVAGKDALQTFQVKKGFHLELVAAEPNIASPVALCFDENGRMFVVEMIDYSERREEMPHLGRIRLLEDTDGDGLFDKSTVFADNLPWPTAVFCYGGGVLVGATPDILYLKDTDGDGKAEVRETLFTGFAEDMKRINVQAMLNSFIWGLDNRIHGATSGDGGMIKSLIHPEAKTVDLHGRDFVIEPRSMTLTSEAGGGQHGLSFDDTGRRFACNNSDHIRLFIYDDRYAARNPAYIMPAPLASIAVDGPAAEVYRISPDEPWRVIRTRWRVAGLVPGPIEGGGRASGYFTGATGTTIYRGNAFPKQFRGNAFIGDAGGNLVHRKILLPDGVGLKAQRPDDEQNVEFVASRDTWFRPVQFANAPDGTLYIIDMYREVIEHPWSLPDNIKKFLDLNSGNDRGRIYRIAPDGFKPPPPPRLGLASTAELVATLENPNGWHRDTAARLLYERQDLAAVPPLIGLLEHSSFPLARLHALHALEGLGALVEGNVMQAMRDSDAAVREHAVCLAERFFTNNVPSPRLLEALARTASDPSVLVRFQLAFSLGQIKGDAKIPPLAALARRDLADSWMQAAILSSLAQGAGALLASLCSENNFGKSLPEQEFFGQLATLIGSGNQPAEVSRALDLIRATEPSAVRLALASAFGEGLRRGGRSLASMRDGLKDIFELAARLALQDAAAEATRVSAIQMLGLTSFAESGARLLSLLTPSEAPAIQLSALAALNHFNVPQVAPALVGVWTNLNPQARSEATAMLLGRPERAKVLLQAIQNGTVPAEALVTSQRKFLREHPDAAVRRAALQVLPEASASRQQVIDALLPALNLVGNAAHGQAIYLERCSSCHRVGTQGHPLGPDLVTVKNTGKEKLLVNILDPNREIRPEYVSYEVQTRDDETLLGLLVNPTPTAITLRQAFGREQVIARADIRKIQSQAQSLMPEGLESGLSPQDLADLLEFIEKVGPARPFSPSSRRDDRQ